jgi:hypothetical protein
MGVLVSFTHSANAISVVEPSISVYWDIHELNAGRPRTYIPSGRYSVLVDLLRPHGYEFTEGYADLDTVDLSSTDILVIASGSGGFTRHTTSELAAIRGFVERGGGLLLMSDIHAGSGGERMQDVLGLFGASIYQRPFTATDITSTQILDHPALDGVAELYLRYSSPIDPGILTPYAFHRGDVMFAAGKVGKGRVALLADGDALGISEWTIPYLDMGDNRQFAVSTFRYLSVPEPSSLLIASVLLATLGLYNRSRRPTEGACC